jgi:hypothetical protein
MLRPLPVHDPRPSLGGIGPTLKHVAAIAALCALAVVAAGANHRQSEPRSLPVALSVKVGGDLGHGGSSRTWTLKREDGRFLATVTESTHFPRPGQRDFKPETSSKTAERAPAEARRFLATVVDDLKIGELETLQARVPLHPTLYNFEVTYPDGRVHRFTYTIEAGHHLDDRYRRLVEECTRFFGG